MNTPILTSKHDLDGVATVPFTVLWDRERGEHVLTKGVPQHRRYAPEETSVTDLLPAVGALPEGRRYGVWAWFERLGKRIHDWFLPPAEEPTEEFATRLRELFLPPPVEEPTAATVAPEEADPERTLPIPRYQDIAALYEAAGARGIAWDLDPDFVPEQCTWCQIDGVLTCLRVLGEYATETCQACGPAAVKTEETDYDLTIELPRYGAHMLAPARGKAGA